MPALYYGWLMVMDENMKYIPTFFYRWKTAMMEKMEQFETALGRVGDRLDMPELQEMSNTGPRSPGAQSPVYNSEPPENDNNHHQTWRVVMDPECGPASIPASCVSEVPNSSSSGRGTRSPRPQPPLDIISRGVISLQQAESLFHIYHQRLDHFLYRILGHHDSLESVRYASPLLTAAICTVGALHSDESSSSNLFTACYVEFKTTVAAQLFSKESVLDDVRGLCIGAFWLNELSWILVSTG